MTEFAPGWFPDPDDPNARRYWDGQRWSAPLPKDSPAQAESREAAFRCREQAMRSGDPEVRRAAVRESAGESTPCVVPNCPEHVLPGSAYCVRHQPASSATAPSPPPPRRIQEFAGVGEPSGRRAIVCPHCGTQGRVDTRQVKQKKGVSGAKLTGAIFTAGVSMVGTGLSRKEWHTELHCGNCGMVWSV